jgi:hypothetical protein
MMINNTACKSHICVVHYRKIYCKTEDFSKNLFSKLIFFHRKCFFIKEETRWKEPCGYLWDTPGNFRK